MKSIPNGGRCRVDEIPRLSFDEFKAGVCGLVGEKSNVAAFFCLPGELGGPMGGSSPSHPAEKSTLCAVVADSGEGAARVLSAPVGASYPSLAPSCPQLQLFERELYETRGIVPDGHPWLKPVRDPGKTEFLRFSGGQSHEVAVGPVHAGVIEPGHFRFQCDGEIVMNLEIVLGYQHRGVEDAIGSLGRLAGPALLGARGAGGGRIPFLMEIAAGDTTVGHAIAYAEALEAIAGIEAPPRAWSIRNIALELERVANHVGDLGALSGDVGYLPTKSFCGRIRGDFLNLTAELCGNRFGRGLVRPGGVKFDLDEGRAASMAERAEKLLGEADEAVDLLWDNPSVLARFEDVGRLSRETAVSLGLVGPVARACGLDADVRRDFPLGGPSAKVGTLGSLATGDVLARARVRQEEYRASLNFVIEELRRIPGGPVFAPEAEAWRRRGGSDRAAGGPIPNGGMEPNSLSIGMVEGWRGSICHCAVTGPSGEIAMYKIVDPSFHNWPGLAYALRGQQISDFPLCNKSFNLSYCGHDL